MMTFCGSCGAEYDDQIVAHKMVDCLSMMRVTLEETRVELKRLRALYQEHADGEDKRESEIVTAINAMRREIEKRMSDFGKRLTLVEHPKMKNVPGMST